MAEKRVQRRLAAILAADVVGYSRLMREDETGTLAQLKTLRKELLDPKAEEHGGRIFKTTGDGTLIEFPSAVDAVQHAVDVQKAMAQRNSAVPEDRRIELRMGINLGDVIIDGDDLYGDGVNVAARLEGLAEPGGICISGIVHEAVLHKLDIALTDMGRQSVKNIAEPLHVFRVNSAERTTAGPSAPTPDRIFDRPAVAVLPFDNLSGDVEQEYFVDGLTEDLITALSLWKSFPVIARNSTVSNKGQSPDVRQVAEELGARYVVEGSVRKGGNRVRVTAQLIDAKTGHHVWAERYDRELVDVFALQDELTQQIAAIVAPELERSARHKVIASQPQSLNAWDLLQRGIARWQEMTGEGTAAAVDYFQAAVKVDENYSQAFAWLAYCRLRQFWLGFTDDRDGTLKRFLEEARRAVELDDSNYFAHFLLGNASIWVDRLDTAISEATTCIELNPNAVEGYSILGHALAMSGNLTEGVDNTKKALHLNPRDPRNHIFFIHLALAYLIAREFELAAEWSNKAIQRKADIAEYHFILAASLSQSEDLDGARDALAECERLIPGYPSSWAARRPYIKSADVKMILDGLRKAGWEG